MRFGYLIGFALSWNSTFAQEANNACKEIEFVACHSLSTDINRDVTILYPKVLFQGSYRPVAYADPKRLSEKSYEQVAAWSELQKQNLCKVLNLGAPVAFETADHGSRVSSGLEIKNSDGKISASPVSEFGYIKSITCTSNQSHSLRSNYSQ